MRRSNSASKLTSKFSNFASIDTQVHSNVASLTLPFHELSSLLAGITDRARSQSAVITCKLNHESVSFERIVIFEDTM